MAVEPVPNRPAAVVDTGEDRALVVADVHAGLEIGLRREGVEIASHADERLDVLRDLLLETDPDRTVVLGDLGHAIGDPWHQERDELEAFLSAARDYGPVTLVKGNHDGDAEAILAEVDVSVEVTDTTGVRLGDVGFVHGHTWPSADVLEANFVCVGHEHPVVRLEDEVGGYRVERVWLRGGLDPEAFEEAVPDADQRDDAELVVFPAFNDLSGGTWVNVQGQEFLAPFLPEGLVDGEAWLLDGTRLGNYDRV
ncbi:metallophosphoesterase [Halobacteriales archaeon Cl-PHB]